MNISGLLETIIALAALFWLITTACSFLLEALHAMLNSRGNALRSFVVEMVGFDKTGLSPQIGKQVMDHPLIKSLYKPTAGSADSTNTLPSYIPSDLFSRTLLDVVIRQGKPSVDDLRRGVKVAAATDASDSFKDFLKAIPFPPVSGNVGVNPTDEQPAWDSPAIRDWITGGVCGLFDDTVASIPSDDSLAKLLFPTAGGASSPAERTLVEVVSQLNASGDGIANTDLRSALAQSRVLGEAGREYADSLSADGRDYPRRIRTVVEACSRFADMKAIEADQVLGSNLVENLSGVFRLEFWKNSWWFIRLIRWFARKILGPESRLARLGSPIDLAQALVGVLGTFGRQSGDLTIESLRKVLSNGAALPADLVATLRPLLDNADQDLDRFRTAIENWFSASMDRASGWFKRRSMGLLFAIGSIVSCIYNLDAIDIAKALLSQPVLRKQGADVGRTILRDPKGMEVWPQQMAFLSLSGEIQSGLKDARVLEDGPALENIKAKLKRLLPTLAKDGELAILGGSIREFDDPKSPVCKQIATKFGEEKNEIEPCDESTFWNSPMASWDPALAHAIFLFLKRYPPSESDVDDVAQKLAAADGVAKALTSATTAYLSSLPGVGLWIGNNDAIVRPVLADGTRGWCIGLFLKVLGWFISGVFISFGAPFWFELLDRVVNVRGTGAKPDGV